MQWLNNLINLQAMANNVRAGGPKKFVANGWHLL